MIYILCCGIVCLSSYIGFLIAKSYVLKDKFYKAMLAMCDGFISNINFKQNKLGELLSNLSVGQDKLLERPISLVKKVVIKQAGESEFENAGCLYFLKKEEKKELYTFISDIGDGNIVNEKQKYETLKYYLTQKSNEAENNRRKNETLCYKLSIAIGVVISILII